MHKYTKPGHDAGVGCTGMLHDVQVHSLYTTVCLPKPTLDPESPAGRHQVPFLQSVV